MSDTLIASLQGRITTLEREAADLRSEAKGHRIKARDAVKRVEELEAQLGTISKERDDFKSRAEAAPGDLQTKLDEAHGQLRERDHRDAWREAIGDQLADKADVRDVWGKLGYKPGDALPTAAEITEQMGKAREAAPYLFKPTPETGDEAPGGAQQAGLRLAATPPPPGTGRGQAPAAPGRVRYTLDDVNAPGWQQSNPALAKALVEGTAIRVG